MVMTGRLEFNLLFEKVIDTIKKWERKLVEPNYTGGISSTMINDNLKSIGTTPNVRLSRLRRLIDAKKIVRILESHSGLTGLIIENSSYNNNGIIEEFDGMWSSSLTDSTSKGNLILSKSILQLDYMQLTTC